MLNLGKGVTRKMRESSYTITTNSRIPNYNQGGEMKVMKKILSLLLAIAMVLSMFASVASANTPSAGQTLYDLGIIQGYGDGDLQIDATWRKQDLVVLLSRLYGQENAAKATAKSHSFTDVKGSFYDGYISWALSKGLVTGKSASTFGFNDEVSNHVFYAVILRALGYDTTGANFNKTPALATTAGFKASLDAAGWAKAATRGQTYDALVEALSINVVGGNKLGAVLGLKGFAQLAVEGVTATNLKQVVVKFSKAVDAAEGAKLANYEVGLAAAPGTNVATGAGAGVTLSADRLSATITINDASTFVNTSAANKVTVKKAVGLAADYVNSAVVVNDGIAPTIVSASSISPTDIKVVFSEPVNGSGLTAAQTVASFHFENNTIMLDPSSAVYAANENAIILKSLSTINEREHVLNVNKAAYNLVDFTGYKVIPGQVKFTHVKNTTAPTVSIESSTETTITLKFSKPVLNVTDANLVFNHTYPTQYTATGANVVANISTTSNHNDTVSYTVTYPNPFPPGSTNIYISYANAAGTKVVDAWGNALAPITLSINTVNDVTKPTVSKAEFVDKNTIKVTFSESVDAVTANNAANYTLKDSAGSAIAVNTAVRQAATNVVHLTTADMVGGVFSLTVKSVKDISHAGNVIADVTVNVTATDSVPPTIVDRNAGAGIQVKKVTENKILIEFSEPMLKSSIEDKNNYRKTAARTPLLGTSDTVVAAADNKSVVITLATGNFVNADKFYVGQVKDAAGNEIAALETEVDLLAVANIAPASVEAINSRTVVLKFDTTVSAGTVDDFTININNAGAVKPIVLVQTATDGKTTITLTTASGQNISDNLLGGVTVSTLTANLKDQYGTPVDMANIAASDKIAPTLLITEVINANDIRLTYSENINPASVNKFTYTVAGKTVSAAVVAGNLVTITVNGAPTLPTVTQVVKIQDDPALNDKVAETSSFGVTASGVTLGATNVGQQGANAIVAVPGVSTFTFSSGFANGNTLTIGGQTLQVDSTAGAGTNAIVKPLGNTGADMALAVKASLEAAGGIAEAAGLNTYTATVAGNVLTLTEVVASGTNVALTGVTTAPGATVTKADTTSSVAAYAGLPEIASITVTSGNKQSSFVVTFDGVTKIVSVLATDNSAAVATKIVAAFAGVGVVGNYTINNAGNVITFTSGAVGVKTDLTRSISN